MPIKQSTTPGFQAHFPGSDPDMTTFPVISRPGEHGVLIPGFQGFPGCVGTLFNTFCYIKGWFPKLNL